MARSAAERQRESRARKRAAKKHAPDVTELYVRRSFSEAAAQVQFLFPESLDAFGVEIRGSSLDEKVQRFDSDGLGPKSMSSMERAVGMAGAFLDAAHELHEAINAFKLKELQERVSEIEKADLGDAQSKSQALTDIVHLSKLREKLERERRHSIRAIRVID